MARLGIGLRPRFLGALILTAAVTLAVAAFALLGPLEQRLRQDATSTLITATLEALPGFEDAIGSSGRPDPREVSIIARALARRVGARVAVVDGRGLRVFDTDVDIVDPFDDALLALAHHKLVHDSRFGRLRLAVPVHIGKERFALVVRKRLNEVASANRVVRNAFITAAGAGLLIAILLGIGLSSRLLRRLRRLHDAARLFEHAGLDAPVPADDSRDEVGELARTFASMQSRLRRQEAARRTFVATASHELRTPLASLEGMLELLGDDLNGEPVDLEDARKRLERAQEQSRRLAQLASDLLDLSRLDASVDLRSEPVELSELCRAVVAEFDRRAALQHTPLELEPADGCWANGDPGSIARIVRILIDNALRVSPPAQPVRVAVGADHDLVSIAVIDDGPGVPLAEREIIFDRFRRGQAAPGEGFGLGLAIGRELADRMGGTLVLDESSTGARFVLSLQPAAVPAVAGVE